MLISKLEKGLADMDINSKENTSRVTSMDLIADIEDNTLEMLRILVGYETVGHNVIKVKFNIGDPDERSYFSFYNINNVHHSIDFPTHFGAILLNDKMHYDIVELQIIVADVCETLATRH